MISFIFSSRAKDNPDHNLMGLLKSFMDFTTPEERKQCEWLIKFDEDDSELGEVKEYIEALSSEVVIRSFTWARNGGRNALHEVQSLLYGYINDKSSWIHVMADDFIFTRPGFVTDILNTDDNFTFIGKEAFPVVRSIAPCFSRKLLDACCGYFGSQPNADGFSSGIRETLIQKYNIDIGTDIDYYYIRNSFTSGEDWEDNHNKAMKNFEMLNRIYQLLAKNVYLCMKESPADSDIHTYKPNIYPDIAKHK
jgi:hypothetical protein|tara:strand:+ start:3275 stop:4027 length:753 start_codon:yes stop_codon:yes gene_type:complete